MYSAKLFAIVLLLAGASADDSHKHDPDEINKNAGKVADFTCHSVEPRLFQLHDLLSKTQMHGKLYSPDVMLLHICDDCSSTHTCRPMQSTNVTIPFTVTYLRDSGSHKKGSRQTEYHTFLESRDCECFYRGSGQGHTHPLQPGNSQEPTYRH